MEKINCLIVDDEPIAREIIKNYCLQLSCFNIIEECENAIEALQMLDKIEVQLIFLDINMPILNGLGLLKSLTKKPKIIFTTAYKEYALEAFELQVSDYLLKPFSFERFLKAMQKTQLELNIIQPKELEKASVIVDKEEGVFFKFGKTIYRFSYYQILFFEAQQNYTRIVSIDQDIRIYQTLSQIEEVLPTDIFLRCHRSYIINKNNVIKIEGNRLFIGKYEIGVGSNYKQSFLEKLGFKG